MKIIKNILFIITFSSFINSCEGFALKKKSTSGEEFLIEKKDPLILPPDFSKLPEPKEQIENQDNEEEKLVIDNVFSEGNSKNDENNDNEINQAHYRMNAAKRIEFQRNAISQVFKEINNDDWIIYSDRISLYWIYI